MIDAQVLRILEGDVIIDHAHIEPTPLSSSINDMIYSNYMNYTNPQSHRSDELNIMRSARGNFNGNRSGRSSSSEHCGQSNQTAINSSNMLRSSSIASYGSNNRTRSQQHQHHVVNPKLYSRRFSGFTNDDELGHTNSSPSSSS